MNRSTIAVIIALGIVMALALNGFSADLDAPAVKHVTVRSEVKRGSDIVNAIELDPANLLNLSKLQDAINNEQAKNTDTDAFYLGAYFAAWIQAAVAINSNQESPGLQNDQTMDVANGYAANWFKEFKSKERELDISDQILCGVVGVSYSTVKPMIDHWSEIAKPS